MSEDTESRQAARIQELEEALECVRRVAGLHFLGGGFDPEHMRSISNYCTGILGGEKMPDDLAQAPEAYFLGVLRENGWQVKKVTP